MGSTDDRVDVLVRSHRIFLPESEFDGSVGIVGERIAGIYAAGEEPTAQTVIDVGDQCVIPGLVDTHCHLRDPGFTHKENFESGTRAAALGGVTTVIDMPNVNPPTDRVEIFEKHIDNARTKAVVDFGHNAAGTNLDEIAGLAKAGATAFKIFMMGDIGRDYPHMPGTMVEDVGQLYELFQAISETGLVCMVHPHNQDVWRHFVADAFATGDRGPESYGRTFFRDEGLVFNLGIATAIELQRVTNVKLHILHTVSKRALKLIGRAKADQQDVTCELNPHSLFLGGSLENIRRLGPYALGIWVPDEHVRALWDALNAGELDIIGTDHSPHTRAEKEEGWKDMFKAPGGSPIVQDYLSLFLTAVNDGHVSLRRIVDTASTAPAKRLGLYPTKGAILVGADADLVVIDMLRVETLSAKRSEYLCGYVPLEGRRVQGTPIMTILRGQVIAKDGEILVEAGYGEFVGDRVA